MAAERWRGVLVTKAQKQVIEFNKDKGMYDIYRSSTNRAEVDGLEGRYKATYALLIFPLPDKSMWEAQDLQHVVKPPKCIKPPGRPRKKRIRPHDEETRYTKYCRSLKRPPTRPTKVDSREASRAIKGRDVAGLNPHCGTPTEGRGTPRGYCDGDPIMGGPRRGYGRGMFSYGTSVWARGFMGLRGRRPPRSG
ncbi:hypothetical protein QJS10_CPA06g01011 [Acorus calamus]|uniref:Uncharacterized protein n=1 Tax=Acorus calamus TaxID=4465 RepID=A0AAV9ERP5_ACOCL|nr:hypothetical protein QJS10_CPA06g01011 [Acorus calamus]